MGMWANLSDQTLCGSLLITEWASVSQQWTKSPCLVSTTGAIFGRLYWEFWPAVLCHSKPLHLPKTCFLLCISDYSCPWWYWVGQALFHFQICLYPLKIQGGHTNSLPLCISHSFLLKSFSYRRRFWDFLYVSCFCCASVQEAPPPASQRG